MSIENTGQYHGVYHVLGGIISPINGVGPSDITIRALVSRVSELVSPEAMFEADAPGYDGGQPEVILALSGDDVFLYLPSDSTVWRQGFITCPRSRLR